MKSSSIDFNLLIFTHEIFQQSILNISFRQFEDNLNSTSDGIYVERPVDILIHITPATTYRASLSDFYSYWEHGLSYITVNFSLFTQNHPVPCKVLSPSLYSSLQSQSLKIYRQDHSKNVFVLSKTTILSVESKYLNGPKLQFRLSLGLNQHVAENDLPFNEQLIANEKEKYIRVLMDRNRYVPSALPTRYVESQVVLKQLIQCTCQSTELTPTSTLLTFTIQNMHPKVILDLVELQLHLQQLMVVYDKLLSAQKSIQANTSNRYNPPEETFEDIDMNSDDEEIHYIDGLEPTGNDMVPIEMVDDTGNQLICQHRITGERHWYTRQPLYNAFEIIPIVYPVPSMYVHAGQCKRFAYRIDTQSNCFAGWYSFPWSLYYNTILPPDTDTNNNMSGKPNSNNSSGNNNMIPQDISLQIDVIGWSIGTTDYSSHHQTVDNTTTSTTIDTMHSQSMLYALLQLHYVCWFADTVSSTQAAVFSLQHQLEVAVEYPTFLTLQEEFAVSIVITNKADTITWSDVKIILPTSDQYLSLPSSSDMITATSEDEMNHNNNNTNNNNNIEGHPNNTAMNKTGLFFPVQEALLPDIGVKSVVKHTLYGLTLTKGKVSLFSSLQIHTIPQIATSNTIQDEAGVVDQDRSSLCFQLLSPITLVVL